MSEKTITIARKITLYPQGDKAEVERVYKYLRDGMEVQSQMMNMCISAMYAAKLRKASKEEIREISQKYSRTPDSKLGSAYKDIIDTEKYPTGLAIAGSISRICKQKLDKACKDGLMYGKTSLPTFKKDMPLIVRNDFVNIRGTKIKSNGAVVQTGLYHGYDSPVDLVEALEKDNKPNVHIKFINGIIFDLVLGNPNKSAELRSVLTKVFSGEYKICDSSIGFDKRTGKKIILNLSLKIPVTEHKLDENVCVGVDLGLAVPVVCALNNNMYVRESIGSYDEFTRQRTKIQAERRRITKSLKDCKGGHGRKKKLAHLDKITLHEREFAKTYNHTLSKRVIDFALKYNAKYINLEDLSGFSSEDRSNFVLRNWSYYELQQMIEYKAEKHCIEVRYINPAYTSQDCSVCGQRGIRSTQATFTCTNPDCKSHTMYKKGFNADFNGARNISMSENYIERKKKAS